MRVVRGQDVVSSTQITPPQPGKPRGTPWPAIAAGAALLVLAAAGSFASQIQLQALLSDLDGRNLARAGLLLERTITEQKADLYNEVRVLSEDTRVRTTVMTPQFSEATVKDVLNDLRRSSGASVMAVLDTNGRVLAVSGADSLRGLDLGASPMVIQARESPASQVWTFPEQVLVVGMAPVRAGDKTSALFLMAYEVGEATLGAIENILGVAGAVVIRDKLVASSSRSPGIAAAVAAASGIENNQNHVVDGNYVVRVSPTSESVGSGRVVWVLEKHQQGARVFKLRVLLFLPVLLVGLSLALAILLSRRRANGESL